MFTNFWNSITAANVFLAIFSGAFSYSAYASSSTPERQHTITLSGALHSTAPSVLTVAQLTKDFVPLQECISGRPDEELQKFEGVSIENLVAKYGDPDVKQVRVTAIDSFQQVFTKQDWINHRSLLVFRSENKLLSTRKRGTFRTVFDLKKFPELRNKIFNPKMMWQVSSLEFLK